MKESHVSSAGLCPLWGHRPASPHSNLQSCKAGQRVSLTTHCPWATCYISPLFFVPRSYNHSSLPKQRQVVAMPFDPREPGIDFTASAFLRLQQTQSPIQSKTSLSRSTTSLQEPRSSGKSMGVFLVTTANAILPVDRDHSVNTDL